jgi:hypothetical protein
MVQQQARLGIFAQIQRDVIPEVSLSEFPDGIGKES